MLLRYLLILLTFVPYVYGAGSETELKDNGGYHFKFEGKDYIFIMRTNGSYGLYPKDMEGNEAKWDRKEAVNFAYSVVRKSVKGGPDRFAKIETQPKSSRTSFQLLVKSTTKTGVIVSTIFKGNSREWSVGIASKLPDDAKMGASFSIDKSLPGYEKGVISTVSPKLKKQFTHACKNIYEKDHHKVNLSQVSMKGRVGFNAKIDVKNTEGHLRMLQMSHNIGSTLNNEFRLHYNNNSSNWSLKKNYLKLSFF